MKVPTYRVFGRGGEEVYSGASSQEAWSAFQAALTESSAGRGFGFRAPCVQRSDGAVWHAGAEAWQETEKELRR